MTKVPVQVAAAHYGVSDETIRRWAKAGVISGERIGPRLMRVDLDSITPKPLTEVSDDAA